MVIAFVKSCGQLNKKGTSEKAASAKTKVCSLVIGEQEFQMHRFSLGLYKRNHIEHTRKDESLFTTQQINIARWP